MKKKQSYTHNIKSIFFDFPLTLASNLCVAILWALQHVPCLGFWLSCARDPSALQRPLRGHPSPGPHCNLGIDFCSPCPLINHQGRRCIPKQAAVGGKGQAVPLTWPPKHLQEGFVQGEKTTSVVWKKKCLFLHLLPEREICCDVFLFFSLITLCCANILLEQRDCASANLFLNVVITSLPHEFINVQMAMHFYRQNWTSRKVQH